MRAEPDSPGRQLTHVPGAAPLRCAVFERAVVAVEVPAGDARERREGGDGHDEAKQGALGDHAAVLSGSDRPRSKRGPGPASSVVGDHGARVVPHSGDGGSLYRVTSDRATAPPLLEIGRLQRRGRLAVQAGSLGIVAAQQLELPAGHP